MFICLPFASQIIQIAPMPVVQTSVHPNSAAAVHPGSPFPVSMATVMTPGAAPPQTVLLTSPPTRSLTQAQHLKDSNKYACLFSQPVREPSETERCCQISIFSQVIMLILLNVQ